MLEGFILAMYVCKEMLSAFGEIENGLKVDDFRTCIGNGGESVGEQLQIAHVLFCDLCF